MPSRTMLMWPLGSGWPNAQISESLLILGIEELKPNEVARCNTLFGPRLHEYPDEQFLTDEERKKHMGPRPAYYDDQNALIATYTNVRKLMVVVLRLEWKRKNELRRMLQDPHLALAVTVTYALSTWPINFALSLVMTTTPHPLLVRAFSVLFALAIGKKFIRRLFCIAPAHLIFLLLLYLDESVHSDKWYENHQKRLHFLDRVANISTNLLFSAYRSPIRYRIGLACLILTLAVETDLAGLLLMYCFVLGIVYVIRMLLSRVDWARHEGFLLLSLGWAVIGAIVVLAVINGAAAGMYAGMVYRAVFQERARNRALFEERLRDRG